MRWLNVIAFAVAAALVVSVYSYKYQTRRFEGRIAVLQRELARESDQVAILKTEWSYLTRPERIQRLGETYLGMRPAAPQQIIQEDAFPHMTGAVDGPEEGFEAQEAE